MTLPKIPASSSIESVRPRVCPSPLQTLFSTFCFFFSSAPFFFLFFLFFFSSLSTTPYFVCLRCILIVDVDCDRTHCSNGPSWGCSHLVIAPRGSVRGYVSLFLSFFVSLSLSHVHTKFCSFLRAIDCSCDRFPPSPKRSHQRGTFSGQRCPQRAVRGTPLLPFVCVV